MRIFCRYLYVNLEIALTIYITTKLLNNEHTYNVSCMFGFMKKFIDIPLEFNTDFSALIRN